MRINTPEYCLTSIRANGYLMHLFCVRTLSPKNIYCLKFNENRHLEANQLSQIFIQTMEFLDLTHNNEQA